MKSDNSDTPPLISSWYAALGWFYLNSSQRKADTHTCSLSLQQTRRLNSRFTYFAFLRLFGDVSLRRSAHMAMVTISMTTEQLHPLRKETRTGSRARWLALWGFKSHGNSSAIKNLKVGTCIKSVLEVLGCCFTPAAPRAEGREHLLCPYAPPLQATM